MAKTLMIVIVNIIKACHNQSYWVTTYMQCSPVYCEFTLADIAVISDSLVLCLLMDCWSIPFYTQLTCNLNSIHIFFLFQADLPFQNF